MTESRSFIKVYRDVLLSPAFRTAIPAAKSIFAELLARYTKHNNGNIHLSFREAHRLLAMNKEPIARGFDDLQARGLVVRTVEGKLRGRQAATWRLTMFPSKDAPATDEWRQWEPGRRPTRSPKPMARAA